MRVGFTGTREGMTLLQKQEFIKLIEHLRPTEFHHGDCVGADVQAAELVMTQFPDIIVHCHPPKEDSGLRAHHRSHIFHDPLGYLSRNRQIVDLTDQLIAIPKETEHQSWGGTWYTVDFAQKRSRPRYIIFPDGVVHKYIVGGNAYTWDENGVTLAKE